MLPDKRLSKEDGSSRAINDRDVLDSTPRPYEPKTPSSGAEEKSSKHPYPRKKVPHQLQRRDTPTCSLEEDVSIEGNMTLATAGDVILSDHGNSQLGKNKRKKTRNTISGSGDSPDSKAAPAVLQAKQDFDSSELEHKRLSSRLSSRRSQERKNSRIEHICTEKKRLETANDALRKENATIQKAIQNHKASRSSQPPILSSFSLPAANVNTTDPLSLLRAAVEVAPPPGGRDHRTTSISGLYSGLHNSVPTMFNTHQLDELLLKLASQQMIPSLLDSQQLELPHISRSSLANHQHILVTLLAQQQQQQEKYGSLTATASSIPRQQSTPRLPLNISSLPVGANLVALGRPEEVQQLLLLSLLGSSGSSSTRASSAGSDSSSVALLSLLLGGGNSSSLLLSALEGTAPASPNLLTPSSGGTTVRSTTAAPSDQEQQHQHNEAKDPPAGRNSFF